ncbi:uncharacterized protein H6S33_012098 [Morchella sextelata]|uniref:uncharacterized protein n=1 Tax=Morchella sextelata TaxID=1174677 RepID=UPI001D0413A0|nr:uncharacterized protein H6S33_012098 [Morchella sextelata]KAH0610571.1 hypothetical protein H6S33_012098 [Morchella sextelata]
MSMGLVLTPQAHLSPLEALLTIYTPILECLVNHLHTPSKIALSQTSKHVRQLLYSYPLFFSHLDFRLPVVENLSFDSYRLGTVYNLDRLLATLPIENRITSLTLDWTAVTGYFLFGKVMDRCQNTLEHLSVRGCRKVSIKHHIVPYLVYQDSVEPLSVSTATSPKRALKSLYVYKARGVRRKPFLIDRKPADGDEPSRYLTTLADKLGIWVDLGLCPTPKLRCPRRREILRRGKEKFCVPFDKRWRVLMEQGANNAAAPHLTLLSPHEHAQRRRFEETQGTGIACDNCDVAILDRCEACVQQMTCSNCAKALCHHCAYARPASPSPSSVDSDESVTNPLIQTAQNTQPFIPIPGAAAAHNFHNNNNAATAPIPIPGAAAASSETNPVMHLLQACCDSATAANPADILCSSCMGSITWDMCDGCQRQICKKHELDRCRKCEGGCRRIFCFSNDSTSPVPGCGESVTGRAGMKDCLSCGKDVCGDCRSRTLTSSPSMTNAASSDDGTETEEQEEEIPRKTFCNCKACKQNFYCTSCWPSKPTPCERRPKEILSHKTVEGDTVIYLVTFYDSEEQQKRWMTKQRIMEDFLNTGGPELITAFEESLIISKPMDILVSPPPPMTTPESSVHGDDPKVRDEEEDNEKIQVGESEWIMERVLGKRQHDPGPLGQAGPGSIDSYYYLCKWLGRGDECTWVPKSTFRERSRERMMMDRFDRNGPDRTAGDEEGESSREAELRAEGENVGEGSSMALGGPLI